MSVETVEQVIKQWETGQITQEQAIGKLMLLVRQLHQRLLKLEARRPGKENKK